MEFRDLKEEEIKIRIATISKKGASLLLFKDARCDMDILDETVGAMHWQRHHTRDNQNCIVSIYCTEKNEWIEKEDTGTESFTEKEKGLASDSFKRACVNWGIGRELYTAPFIWVKAVDIDILEHNGKFKTYDKFIVEKIQITNKVITGISIINTSKKKRVFVLAPKDNKNESN